MPHTWIEKTDATIRKAFPGASQYLFQTEIWYCAKTPWNGNAQVGQLNEIPIGLEGIDATSHKTSSEIISQEPFWTESTVGIVQNTNSTFQIE